MASLRRRPIFCSLSAALLASMYTAVATITLRPSILDPQGKAMQHALHDLGHGAVEQVRAGKHIELQIEAASAEEAERIARQACEQLLANPVMEDFTVTVEEAEGAPVA